MLETYELEETVKPKIKSSLLFPPLRLNVPIRETFYVKLMEISDNPKKLITYKPMIINRLTPL